jgi:hypothetical protein
MFRVSTPPTTFLSPGWCIVPPPCVSTNNFPFTGFNPSSIQSLSATDALISARDQVPCDFFCSPAALSVEVLVHLRHWPNQSGIDRHPCKLDENDAVRKEAIT